MNEDFLGPLVMSFIIGDFISEDDSKITNYFKKKVFRN